MNREMKKIISEDTSPATITPPKRQPPQPKHGRVEFKVIFLGQKDVGKTAIHNVYLKNQMPLKDEASTGYRRGRKDIEFQNEQYRLEVWDMFGESRFAVLPNSYMRGTNGYVYVYDITSEINSYGHLWESREERIEGGKSRSENFDQNISSLGYVWVTECTQKPSLLDAIALIEGTLKRTSSRLLSEQSMILVGNKLDRFHQRQVSTEKGEETAAKYGTAFIECSAKECTNIDEIFTKLLWEKNKKCGKDMRWWKK